jgi:hypothetical protein
MNQCRIGSSSGLLYNCDECNGTRNAENCITGRVTVSCARRQCTMELVIDCDILDCNTLWSCRWLPAFRRNILFPSSGFQP